MSLKSETPRTIQVSKVDDYLLTCWKPSSSIVKLQNWQKGVYAFIYKS